MASSVQLKCHLCGQEHLSVPLQRGQKARCRRCDTLLAIGPRFGPQAPLCFALTGLALSIPALLLPFVGAEELGDKRVSLLLTGVGALWDGGMRALGFLVLLCGALIPFVMLVILVTLYSPEGFGRRWVSVPTLIKAAKLLGTWAFPEVQVLAVLVGVVKLRSLVQTDLGPGFWCYCGMAVSLLLAQHGFEFMLPEADKVPAGQGRARPK